MNKVNYIFVYGLLKSTYDNEPACFVRKNCELISEGSFKGSLYDIGTYPGAVFTTDVDSLVHGEVYRIVKNKAELEAYLDKFEGVGNEFPTPNEYKREIIVVSTPNGDIKASCYLYNWNLDNSKLIESGRYENAKGNRG